MTRSLELCPSLKAMRFWDSMMLMSKPTTRTVHHSMGNQPKSHWKHAMRPHIDSNCRLSAHMHALWRRCPDLQTLCCFFGVFTTIFGVENSFCLFMPRTATMMLVVFLGRFPRKKWFHSRGKVWSCFECGVNAGSLFADSKIWPQPQAPIKQKNNSLL